MQNRAGWPHGDHPFAGLLPEGHRLTVLRQATKASLDDELTLLLAVGADVPGDVQVVPAGVVHDRCGIPGLLVDRFDRALGADRTVVRLAMEDAAQVLNVLPAKNYAVATEDLIAAVASHTLSPPVATRNLYLQFVFAWLTGNGDLHAKNISVLRGSDGRWTVSPVYGTAGTRWMGDHRCFFRGKDRLRRCGLDPSGGGRHCSGAASSSIGSFTGGAAVTATRRLGRSRPTARTRGPHLTRGSA